MRFGNHAQAGQAAFGCLKLQDRVQGQAHFKCLRKEACAPLMRRLALKNLS
jgi:hypothetical protein